MNNKFIKYEEELASGKNPPTDSGRSHTFGQVSFDDLKILTAQVAVRPEEYFNKKDASKDGENIKTQTTIRGKKQDIILNGPAIVAAMSHGALPKSAKIAIAKGASLAGTADNSGEGGIPPEEAKVAKISIRQYSTGRFGVTEIYLKGADIIEVKYGQGAKPGQGGLLPGDKVTEEIAKIRSNDVITVKPGHTVHSPPAHPDMFSTDDLKKRIAELGNKIGGKPIIVKIGACDLESDLPLLAKIEPDVIAIDGEEGGTGASPGVMLHNTGMPTIQALVTARYILDRLKEWDKIKKMPQLWIGGGIRKGSDVAKCLALGADLVFVGMATMRAAGCINCRSCHKPTEIRKKTCTFLKDGYDIEKGAQGVANFFNNIRKEVQMLAAACGLKSIYDFNDRKKFPEQKLLPLTPEMAAITGLPFGQERTKKYFDEVTI